MRIRPAHAAGTAPPRFVVGKKRRRSKSEMGDARSADRVYRRSARARQGPHTLRSDGLRLRSRARSPPHLAGCREPNPEIIQERENVLSLTRWFATPTVTMLALASIQFSRASVEAPEILIRYSFPVCMRGIAEAPWGLDNFSRSPTDAR